MMDVVKTTDDFMIRSELSLLFSVMNNAERDHKQAFTASWLVFTLSSWRIKMLNKSRRIHET